MNKQTALMEKPDRIIHEQLSRKAVLSLVVGEPAYSPDGIEKVRLSLDNSGDRGTSSWSLELLVPEDLFNAASSAVCESTLDPDLHATPLGRYRKFGKTDNVSVFPKTQREVGFIMVNRQKAPAVTRHVLWRVFCDDGAFPASFPGTLTLPLGRD